MGAPVGPMELPQLEETLRDPDTSNTLVMLLRFIVSAEIQLREDFFAPFVLVCLCGGVRLCVGSLCIVRTHMCIVRTHDLCIRTSSV